MLKKFPDGEDYPGGGLMIRYKDPKGIVYKDLFFPDDLEAYWQEYTFYREEQSDGVARSRSCQFLEIRELRREHHRLHRSIFDVSGHPQAVSTCIKVIAGARPSLASEREGDVIAALDDIGRASIIYSMMDGIPSSIASPATCSTSQLQSGKRAGHERSPVSVGPDQLVKMLDLQYSFQVVFCM
ncbi:hypothetical protein EDD18DRAFT_1109969 [Armillaria luteobubalina]|uniref:Uncharacterized protein n=1 Tax=Armillaria luteobubalina TaxID=153913 RepID=A0AA39PTE5_9AGAR|nr:hypothetical protein EDD18DRAFT_1109969 [Armillaria luteobubalina]